MSVMDEPDWLAEQFEASRPRLHAVAYRMLGSHAEAEEAVQEAWLRLSRTDPGSVDNLGGWLTTVVGRLCLDRLRTRRSRREDVAGEELPDLATTSEQHDPAHQALLAESVGAAM